MASWELHESIYKVRGTYQENKETFFKSKTVAAAFFRTGISHEDREFIVDSGGIYAYDEQQWERHISEIGRILYAYCSEWYTVTTTEEATIVNVWDLDIFVTVQLL